MLEVVDLSVDFGGIHALRHVSFGLREGMLLGLVGANGAGKTTLVDAITGFVPVSSGQVLFEGRDVTKVPAHQRAQRGLGRTWQSVELFDEITVRENLQVAAEPGRWWSPLVDLVVPNRASSADRVDEALAVMDIRDLAEAMPRELSHGQRKLVGLARALAARPRVVCLDEPAAGLDTSETELLGQRLRGLLHHGVTVLLIDHDMGLIMGICDEIVVLEFGQVIAQGPPEQIRSDERVVASYLGTGGVATEPQ